MTEPPEDWAMACDCSAESFGVAPPQLRIGTQPDAGKFRE